MASTQQQQFELLLLAQINSDKELSKESYELSFKSENRAVLQVMNRISFKNRLEQTLKKNRVRFSSKLVSGSSFDSTIITFNSKNLTVMYKPGSAKGPKATTEQQELGTAYIFTQALVNNVKYSSPEDILAKEEKQLKKIFKVPENKDFPYEEWLQSFYHQQKVMLEKYGSPKFSRFDRNGGFMEYISKLVNTKFGISKKDTWDPADIWAVDGPQSEIEKIINKSLEAFPDYKDLKKQYSGNQNLLDDKLRLGIIKLNSVLIDLLKKEKVIGISLKLTDKNASIEEVNVQVVDAIVKNNKALIDTVTSPFECIPSKDFVCNFEIPTGKNTFTQDVRIKIRDEDGGEYNFQIKANSSESTNGSNLKFEATIKGKAKARAGKVPVDILEKFISKMNLNTGSIGKFTNNYSKYPRTVGEFAEKLDDYKKMYQEMTAKGISFGVDEKTFISNISKSFSDKNKAVITNATCKLMGLHFMYMLSCVMTEEQMKTLLTDMAFLSQKKNTRSLDTFGPFIKIA